MTLRSLALILLPTVLQAQGRSADWPVYSGDPEHTPQSLRPRR